MLCSREYQLIKAKVVHGDLMHSRRDRAFSSQNSAISSQHKSVNFYHTVNCDSHQMPSNALTQQIFFRAIAMPTSAINLYLEPGQKATLQPVTW